MLEDRIYTLNTYYQELFGEKVYKLSLNPGTTCPNRDGTCGFGGCAFCSEGGSGDFTASALLPMEEQLAFAKALISRKGARRFIGYFQAFSGTYAPTERLRSLYASVLCREEILGLSVGTRPDCLPEETVALLAELRGRYRKPVFVELGLQTARDDVAAACNRGYSYRVFADAVTRLNEAEIPVVVHLIFGLPGETRTDMLQSVEHICRLPISGVKLQQLHILRGTPMERWYREHPEQFAMLEEAAYVDTLVEAVARIPRNIVIHRLTGDGPKRLLIAPLYSGNKKHMLASIERRMREQNVFQGQALLPKKTEL